VGGGVRGGEGVERVDAAEEDLKEGEGLELLCGDDGWNKRTVLVSTSKWC
jgi:hypothetical protein